VNEARIPREPTASDAATLPAATPPDVTPSEPTAITSPAPKAPAGAAADPPRPPSRGGQLNLF